MSKVRTMFSLSLLSLLVLLTFTGCCCCKKAKVEAPVVKSEIPRPSVTDAGMDAKLKANMKVVYFDFDKSNIRKDQEANIVADAAYLKTIPEVKVVVEGNCDERGTVEYNMALGERRANSVRKALIEKGIDANRLSIVSFGKSRPVVANAKNEADHQKNRRDEFSAAK